MWALPSSGLPPPCFPHPQGALEVEGGGSRGKGKWMLSSPAGNAVQPRGDGPRAVLSWGLGRTRAPSGVGGAGLPSLSKLGGALSWGRQNRAASCGLAGPASIGSKEPPGPGPDEPRQEGVGHQQGGQTPPLLGRGQRSAPCSWQVSEAGRGGDLSRLPTGREAPGWEAEGEWGLVEDGRASPKL